MYVCTWTASRCGLQDIEFALQPDEKRRRRPSVIVEDDWYGTVRYREYIYPYTSCITAYTNIDCRHTWYILFLRERTLPSSSIVQRKRDSNYCFTLIGLLVPLYSSSSTKEPRQPGLTLT